MVGDSPIGLIKLVLARAEINKERERRSDWLHTDSNLADVETFFLNFIADRHQQGAVETGQALRNFLERELLASKRSGLVMVELGGKGSQLARDLQGVVEKSCGLVLTGKQKEGDSDLVDASNHSIFQADIFLTKGPLVIKDWLGLDDKIDVLFEILRAPMRKYPDNSYFLLTILNRYYNLMAENSAMFLQLPHLTDESREDILEWINYINREFVELLVLGDLSPLEEVSRNKMAQSNKLFIRRHPGSPDKMPGLDII